MGCFVFVLLAYRCVRFGLRWLFLVELFPVSWVWCFVGGVIALSDFVDSLWLIVCYCFLWFYRVYCYSLLGLVAMFWDAGHKCILMLWFVWV